MLDFSWLLPIGVLEKYLWDLRQDISFSFYPSLPTIRIHRKDLRSSNGINEISPREESGLASRLPLHFAIRMPAQYHKSGR